MRVITLNSNKTVIAVKTVLNDYILQDNEIQSEVGEAGQVLQNDGSFITPTPAEVTSQPTLEDKVNYLYYKAMGVI